MILVERHYRKGSVEIKRLCETSKELYNRCQFIMRKSWFEHKFPMPNISILIKELKPLECYKQLHNTKTATQTIRKCLIDWTNFRKALTAYKKDPSKFYSKPKPPNYKEKMAQVIFFNETIRRSKKIINTITPTNDCFTIPSDKKYKQVVITPKKFGFIIEVQYETNEQKETKEIKKTKKPDKNKICCIDIGLNNLCAITSDQHSPLLVNGRIVKSFNQWYNKKQCKNRLRKRYFRIENYFHHVSKLIVSNCVKHNIGTIIIGKNNGWKTEINLGKKTNQAFCFVPIHLLLEKIKYKATMEGIEVVFTEESYTSKSSFYDRDPLPAYGDAVPEFSGKRVKRGLYRSRDGRILNADINGSANIGRKVIGDNDNTGVIVRLDRSLAARPIVINPLLSNKQYHMSFGEV